MTRTSVRRAGVAAAALLATFAASVAYAHGTPDQSNEPAHEQAGNVSRTTALSIVRE